MMETGSVDDAEALDELLIAALPDGITCEGMNPSESSNEVRA